MHPGDVLDAINKCILECCSVWAVYLFHDCLAVSAAPALFGCVFMLLPGVTKAHCDGVLGHRHDGGGFEGRGGCSGWWQDEDVSQDSGSCPTQTLSMRPGMPSGPAASPALVLLSAAHMWVDSDSVWASGLQDFSFQ